MRLDVFVCVPRLSYYYITTSIRKMCLCYSASIFIIILKHIDLSQGGREEGLSIQDLGGGWLLMILSSGSLSVSYLISEMSFIYFQTISVL
jgi:hypothetical protein